MKKGTTFTLDPDTTLKVRRLRKLRKDATAAQTIRYLVLKGLGFEVD